MIAQSDVEARGAAAAESANRSFVRSELLAMMLEPAADADDVRRHTLRVALRWWRSTLEPASVGLPVAGRRRPGLTRGDVAELADLSLAWYTLFESGSKDHTCSPRAVDRIAGALALEDVDRAILQLLASREAFRSFRILYERACGFAA